LGSVVIQLTPVISFVSSVAERAKALFLQRPCDRNRVIYVQCLPSSYALLRPWIKRFTIIISA